MTGTALEASGELRSVYGLRVVRIPTNRPQKRIDFGARLHTDGASKWRAVTKSVQEVTGDGRSVLIGTRSVAASEEIGALLQESGLSPVILNARQDSVEAQIVAEAGQPGRITVATNMAGRGTDIHLTAPVREAGGLHVVLTEFHESSRIDRQLFGRSGRQGDPGSFECIVSLSDELFQKYSSPVVRKFVAHAIHSERLAAYALWAIRAIAQASAQRASARARKSALAEDERFQKSISFAGRPE
jgi:preprotein translocase subunit SecA